MARPYIELFIGDRQVEFTSPPQINMTYTHEDLHNPTVIKNSFSKTVTIDGTPRNNQIFGAYFNMQREVAYSGDKNTGAYFNAAKKVPFTLYRNGERMEHGYCKLDNVKRNRNNVQYNITLYGGLGQFLYNLQTKEDGEQMKLSDLNYGGGDSEFNLEVNKNTVRDAWNHINGEPVDYIYDKINFVPAYNGIPSDFSADKVAIYADGFKFSDDLIIYDQLTTSIKDDDKTYTTVDGWMIGELDKEYDEWQMKDLRSYLQRPAIRFKEIITACCDKDNNGGYKVDLDPDFFNDDNPYYNDAWMTLPLVTEIEREEFNTEMKGDHIVPQGVLSGERFSLKVQFVLDAECNYDRTDLYTGAHLYDHSVDEYFHTSNRATYVQLILFNSDGEPMYASPYQSFYSDVTEGVDFTYEPEINTSLIKTTGKYQKVDDNLFRFNRQTYELTVDGVYSDGMYGEVIVKTADIETGLKGYVGYLWNNPRGYWYPDQMDTITHEAVISFNSREMTVSKLSGYKYINKKTLLNSEHTPCDYFLSYLKMFNLHIWQNDDDVIMVRLRKNYFTNERYDLEDLIDRGRDIQITPLTFDAKWYNFSNECLETGLNKDYKDTYGTDYGVMKVDTNYNFDSSSKNIFEGNVFKSAITSRNQSKYYVDVYQYVEGDNAYYPPFMLDGCQTLLFCGSDTAEGAYLTPKTSIEGVNWWREKYYDFMPKPCFTDAENGPVDGANVLLFYNGKASTTDVEGNPMRIQISDDIPQFETLNEGEPCWIWGYNWKSVIMDIPYLPMFGRYKTNDNNWVTHSWDFGTPQALYIPDYQISDNSNLYTQFWQSYIRDRYNVNTRITECDVLLKERVVGDWLRRFYYWDGCWWIMNKITDYNPCNNGTTKCEMVKVNEPTNYSK